MSDEKKAREIDLLDLFKSMGDGIINGINSLGNLILWNIKTALKYYWLLGVFGAVGIVLGLITYFNFEPAYQAEMVLRSNSVPAYEMVPYINQLGEVNFEKENVSFAKIFKLDTAQVKQIQSIEAFYYVDLNKDGIIDYVDYDNDFNARDTANNIDKRQLLVRATINNPEQFNVMSDAIANYINRNTHFQRANKARVDRRKEMIKTLEDEFILLDSLERRSYFIDDTQPRLEFGKSLVVGNGTKQLFYKDKMRLQNEIDYRKEELYIHSGIVSILSPFPVQSTPTQSNLSALIIRVVELVFLGYMIALILQLISFIKTKL